MQKKKPGISWIAVKMKMARGEIGENYWNNTYKFAKLLKALFDNITLGQCEVNVC